MLDKIENKFYIFKVSEQDEHKLISNTRQLLNTNTYTHLRHLQRQGIEPLPLRV